MKQIDFPSQELKDLREKARKGETKSGLEEQAAELSRPKPKSIVRRYRWYDYKQRGLKTKHLRPESRIIVRKCKCGQEPWGRICLLCGEEVAGQCKKCHSKIEHKNYPVFPGGLCPHCHRLTQMPKNEVLKAWYFHEIDALEIRKVAGMCRKSVKTIRRCLEDMIHLCQYQDCLKMLHPSVRDLRVVFLLGRTVGRRTTPKADGTLWYGSEEIEAAIERCKIYGITPHMVSVYCRLQAKFTSCIDGKRDGPTHPMGGYTYEREPDDDSESRYGKAYREYCRFLKV